MELFDNVPQVIFWVAAIIFVIYYIPEEGMERIKFIISNNLVLVGILVIILLALIKEKWQG